MMPMTMNVGEIRKKIKLILNLISSVWRLGAKPMKSNEIKMKSNKIKI